MKYITSVYWSNTYQQRLPRIVEPKTSYCVLDFSKTALSLHWSLLIFIRFPETILCQKQCFLVKNIVFRQYALSHTFLTRWQTNPRYGTGWRKCWAANAVHKSKNKKNATTANSQHWWHPEVPKLKAHLILSGGDMRHYVYLIIWNIETNK